jgi:hypothetical protein
MELNEETGSDVIFVDAVEGRIDIIDTTGIPVIPEQPIVTSNVEPLSQPPLPQPPPPQPPPQQQPVDQSKRAVGRPKNPANASAANTTTLAVVSRPLKPPPKKLLKHKHKLLAAAAQVTNVAGPTAPATNGAHGTRYIDGFGDLAIVNVQAVAKCVGALMQERGENYPVDPTFVFSLTGIVQTYAVNMLQAADTFRSLATDTKLVNGRHTIAAELVLRQGNRAPPAPANRQ